MEGEEDNSGKESRKLKIHKRRLIFDKRNLKEERRKGRGGVER